MRVSQKPRKQKLTLGPPRENADATTNFGVTADDRVKSPFFRFGSEILGVLLERFEALLGGPGVDALPTSDLLSCVLERVRGDAGLLEDRRDGRVLNACEDEVVLGDERVVLQQVRGSIQEVHTWRLPLPPLPLVHVAPATHLLLHDLLRLAENLAECRRKADIVGWRILRRKANDEFRQAALDDFGLCSGCRSIGSVSSRSLLIRTTALRRARHRRCSKVFQVGLHRSEFEHPRSEAMT